LQFQLARTDYLFNSCMPAGRQTVEACGFNLFQ
jgi:hypothetical protein